MLKKFIKKIFKYFGYRIISNKLPIDFTKSEIKLIQTVRNFTMTSPERIKSLIDSINYLNRNNL